MATRTAVPNTADHDTVMNWLQNLEMKDHKLGAARSVRARAVEITTAIDRLLDKACTVFPHMERHMLEEYLRSYIDPQDRVRAKPPVGSAT